jgi:hypothetical protein
LILLINIIACGSDAGFTKEIQEPEAGPYDIETPCEWESVEAHPEWERYDCNPLQASGAWTASFAWVEGEGFRTWQVRGDYFESWELVHSSSENGVEWSDWEVLLESPADEWDSLLWDTLAVRPHGDGWLMTHQGIGDDYFYGIGLIESTDGLSWERGDTIVPNRSSCWPVEITSPDEVYVTKGSMFDSRCDLYQVTRDGDEWTTASEPHLVSEGMGYIDWGLIKEHEYAIHFSDVVIEGGAPSSIDHYMEWDGELLDLGLSDEVASFEAIEIGPHIYVWIQDQGETHYFRLLGQE